MGLWLLSFFLEDFERQNLKLLLHSLLYFFFYILGEKVTDIGVGLCAHLLGATDYLPNMCASRKAVYGLLRCPLFFVSIQWKHAGKSFMRVWNPCPIRGTPMFCKLT